MIVVSNLQYQQVHKSRKVTSYQSRNSCIVETKQRKIFLVRFIPEAWCTEILHQTNSSNKEMLEHENAHPFPNVTLLVIS